MNRRNLLGATAAGLATLAATSRVQAADKDALLELLKASSAEKKGVTVYVDGAQIGMLVTALGDVYVEGRSQAQSRIVVKIASIDAATMA